MEKKVVKAYASKSLNKGERNEANYSAKKLEFLAIVWAVSEKCIHYLMGAKYTVITDNSAVACILDKKVLSALEQRWIGRRAPFELIFKYRAGKHNTVEDALSRMKGDEVDGDDINRLYEHDLEINEITIVKEMEGEELRRL